MLEVTGDGCGLQSPGWLVRLCSDNRESLGNALCSLFCRLSAHSMLDYVGSANRVSRATALTNGELYINTGLPKTDSYTSSKPCPAHLLMNHHRRILPRLLIPIPIHLQLQLLAILQLHHALPHHPLRP